MAPYKNILNWRNQEKSDSKDQDESGTPASTSSPQIIPNQGNTSFNPSLDEDLYSSISPTNAFGGVPSSGVGLGLGISPSTDVKSPSTAHWENVSPSSASVASSKPSTVQSSMFSRNAPTFGTMSSYGSSGGSGFGRKQDITATIAEEGSLSTSSENRGVMRVVNPHEMDSLVDDSTSVRSRAVGSNLLSSSPHQPRTAVIPNRSLLPDVSATSGMGDHSYRAERGGSVSSSSWSSSGMMGSSSVGGNGGGSGSGFNFGSGSFNRQSKKSPQEELKELADNLTLLMNSSRSIDIPRASVSINQYLRQSTLSPALENISEGEITIHSCPSLTRIIKVVFHFTDNLLVPQNFHQIRMFILKALYNLGVQLKLIHPVIGTVPYPRNFAIGSVDDLPGQDIVESLIHTVANNDSNGISEQDGAFIAPVLRGFAPEFSILSLSFGFPRLEQNHIENISSLYEISSDIHFYAQKNSIKVCAASEVATAPSTSHHVPSTSPTQSTATTQFVPPYRIPLNEKSPPISLSIATKTATNLSGTLGGYVYPKIDPTDPNLAEYAKSTFAITCAHVCLSESPKETHPFISVPSPVLVNIYKNALIRERNKYPVNSQEYHEYNKAVIQLDVTSSNESKPFGQVVWGERTVVNSSISDIAIIKCSSNMKCRNFLGDDISFAQYDPGLMFGNLYVKRIVRKMYPGMSVFKYGSTSKYTNGKLNGTRMVYWADGKLQSSEFVVCSETPVFASGGDSGAWVLQKSEDMRDEESNSTVLDDDDTASNGSTSGPCLGVVGMLHSYDGERKEFGLFTPIESILDRLHEVTNIKWGVVGVADETEDPLIGGSESSDSGDDASDTEQQRTDL